MLNINYAKETKNKNKKNSCSEIAIFQTVVKYIPAA